MVVRLTGAVVFLLGTVVAILAVWGLLNTASMVSNSFGEPGSMDAHQWSASWRLSSVMLILIGLSTAVAGIVVSMKRAWGLLLLAIAAAVTAVFPWVLLGAGSVRYAFELPRTGETAFCVIVAVCSIVAYFRYRRHWLGRDNTIS